MFAVSTAGQRVAPGRWILEPGTYRFRHCDSSLDTVSESGLEGNDRCSIAIW